MKKNTHGGKRPNSGRKPSKIKTEVVSVRVRVDWVDIIKKVIKDKVEELKDAKKNA